MVSIDTFVLRTRRTLSKARSDFRNENAKGLPESYYQSASSWEPEWHPAPDIDKSGAKFHQSTPSGIPFNGLSGVLTRHSKCADEQWYSTLQTLSD